MFRLIDMEHNPDITMQIQFMHDEQLCTIINIDFKHKQIFVENKTDRVFELLCMQKRKYQYLFK